MRVVITCCITAFSVNRSSPTHKSLKLRQNLDISLAAQNLVSLCTNQIAQFLTNLWIFRLGQVVTACIEEAGDAQTGTVELTQHEGRLVIIDRHEVCSPQERQLRHLQVQSFHDVRNRSLQHLTALLPLRCIWWEDSLLVVTADTSRVLVMLNTVQPGADTHEASLTLIDTRKVALIDHESSSLQSSLEVHALALGCPCTRLLSTTVRAELPI